MMFRRVDSAASGQPRRLTSNTPNVPNMSSANRQVRGQAAASPFVSSPLTKQGGPDRDDEILHEEFQQGRLGHPASIITSAVSRRAGKMSAS